MTYKIHIDESGKTTKLRQVIEQIKYDIERGILTKGEQLPSITEFSRVHKIARETVEKAYKVLKKDGYVEAVPAKGNFVSFTIPSSLRVLMVLNKMSSYKKEVYDAFVLALGKDAQVELQIHHYDPRLFKQIIEERLGRYHYYVIMPHFFTGTPDEEFLQVLEKIAPEEVLILDRKVYTERNYSTVYQDFKLDIYEAFLMNKSLFNRYRSLTLIFPEMSHHPNEIIEGIKDFCGQKGLLFSVTADVNSIVPQKGTVYISIIENDLGTLIKAIRKTDLELGSDLGVISFNETVLKELLGITVVTTDFSGMGKTAAEMIRTRKFEMVRNSFKFIKRLSL